MRFRSRSRFHVYWGLIIGPAWLIFLYGLRALAGHNSPQSISLRVFNFFTLALLTTVTVGAVLRLFLNYTDLTPEGVVIRLGWSKKVLSYSQIKTVRMHVDEHSGRLSSSIVELRLNDSSHFPELLGVEPINLESFLNALRIHVTQATFDL